MRLFFQLPLDRLLPMLLQKGIALREMAAAKKALISRKRTGMSAFQNKMLWIGNKRRLLLCICSP